MLEPLRLQAREHFLARATPMPVAWGPLLAGADGPLAGHPVLGIVGCLGPLTPTTSEADVSDSDEAG